MKSNVRIKSSYYIKTAFNGTRIKKIVLENFKIGGASMNC